MGRKPLGEAARRKVLSIRMTERVFNSLEDAAQWRGLSVAQEIERRLDVMLSEEEHLGKTTYAFMRFLAATIHAIEERVEASWTDDEAAYTAVAAAITKVMHEYAPPARIADSWNAEYSKRMTALNADIDKMRLALCRAVDAPIDTDASSLVRLAARASGEKATLEAGSDVGRQVAALKAAINEREMAMQNAADSAKSRELVGRIRDAENTGLSIAAAKMGLLPPRKAS